MRADDHNHAHRVQVGRVLEVADGHKVAAGAEARQLAGRGRLRDEERRQRQLAGRHAIDAAQQPQLRWRADQRQVAPVHSREECVRFSCAFCRKLLLFRRCTRQDPEIALHIHETVGRTRLCMEASSRCSTAESAAGRWRSTCGISAPRWCSSMRPVALILSNVELIAQQKLLAKTTMCLPHIAANLMPIMGRFLGSCCSFLLCRHSSPQNPALALPQGMHVLHVQHPQRVRQLLPHVEGECLLCVEPAEPTRASSFPNVESGEQLLSKGSSVASSHLSKMQTCGLTSCSTLWNGASLHAVANASDIAMVKQAQHLQKPQPKGLVSARACLFAGQ